MVGSGTRFAVVQRAVGVVENNSVRVDSGFAADCRIAVVLL
jgi:hypothetical protein